MDGHLAISFPLNDLEQEHGEIFNMAQKRGNTKEDGSNSNRQTQALQDCGLETLQAASNKKVCAPSNDALIP